MIKNQANIYQFVLRDMIGQGMTGLSPTVQIRKDTGSFAATINTPTEVGYGLYEVALTATECNCDIMAIEVSLPDGQFPAILTNEYLTSSGGATPQQIWEYPTRTLTASPTDISGLATSTALSSVAVVATAIKAKTDNLPANPAATGDAMTLTSDYDAAKTASQLTTDDLPIPPDITALESLIEKIAAGLYHWIVANDVLTIYNNNDEPIATCTLTKDSSGAIVAVTPITNYE